ncbi:MAG TPA: cytochrome c biogenesis CcdA family protein [Burkholderiaceae bacterium]
MDFGPVTYALGYLAGVLSTLSPCVLPLLPILIASATTQHRFGPLALAFGLTLSFAGVGLFIATLGASIGLDAGLLRQGAAVLLIGFGVLLLSVRAQARFARAAGGLSVAGDGLLARLAGTGWRGQFAVGLVLGLVWSPCVGPTLGAASTLAAQGRQLPQVALLMLLFGLGAGTPLIALGSLSREAMQRLRGRLLALGQRGRWLLGLVLLLVGLAILTGWDRDIETWTVEHSPDWLTALTTRY